MLTFSVDPETSSVPASLMASAYTDCLCPLQGTGWYPSSLTLAVGPAPVVLPRRKSREGTGSVHR